MKQCTRCKAENTDTASICSTCGAVLPDTQTKAQDVTKVKLQGVGQVSVIDFDIPFISLVYLMIKITIAAIPAVITLTVIAAFVLAMIFGTAQA